MSVPPSVRRLRPWYFVAAMCAMWVVGVVSTMSGWRTLSYLRGDESVATEADPAIEQAHGMLRSALVGQKAKMEALGRHYERAFPLAAAGMLVGGLLVFAAGAAIAARPGSRRLALQAVLANFLVATLAFFLLAPARYAAADAAAEDTVDNGTGVPQDMTRKQAIDQAHTLALRNEQVMAALELLLFVAAAMALTRPRTKAYFEALEGSLADAEP